MRPTPRATSLLAAAALFALAVIAGGCAERARLVIELRGGTVDLTSPTSGATVKIALLDSLGAVQSQTEVSGAELASETRLFEGADLQEGETYRLAISAQLSSACGGAGAGVAVGASAPFVYGEELTRVPVHIACADTSQTAGALTTPRLYHSATWVPEGGPMGSVLLVGGARWQKLLDIADINKATPHDSIERYDPVEQRSRLLSAKLTTPRFYHSTVRLADNSLVVFGGIKIELGAAGSTPVASPLASVERVAGERVARLADLAAPHALHLALPVGPSKVLVVGGSVAKFIPTLKAELYDVVAGKPLPFKLMATAFHVPPVGVSLGDQVLLYGGQPSRTLAPAAQRFCAGSGCDCGSPPCFDRLEGLPVDRTAMGAAAVACPAGGSGALYMVGGRRDERAWDPPGGVTFYKEIYCVDLQRPGKPRVVGELPTPRYGHTVTTVRGGSGSRLLVAGGVDDTGNALASAELIDAPCACPAGNTLRSSRTISLNAARTNHTATSLPDGSVLLVGGLVGTDSAERFVPAL